MKLDGKIVRARCEELGMTMREVSRKAGLIDDALSDYTRGRKNCPKKKIEDIADVLDMSWLEIVDLRNTYY